MKKNNGSLKRLFKLFLKTDMFGQRVELNVNGESSINSTFGAILSIIIYTTVLAFAMYRFYVMVTHSDTKVNQNVLADAISKDFIFDFDENNFKIAVGVKTDNGTVLDDYAGIYFQIDGPPNFTKPVQLASHRCTDEDIAEFYPL